MDQVVRNFLILAIASSCTFGQELTVNYNARSTCPATQDHIESIKEEIHSLIDNSVLPVLKAGLENGACGCGGPGWRRVAYLDMSDPTQTCPPAWELITTPRRSCNSRSCARPSNAPGQSCYSAMFSTQGIQYSQVCGRIIGYQFGQPKAFFSENSPGRQRTIDGPYVDGASLTYGSPRQHIWTFANALNEHPNQNLYNFKCPCTNVTEQRTINVPSFVSNDYFCETGVPPGQSHRNFFFADDPLWDGLGCSPTSTCCTFNNPPWFCKQLPQSTNADLEVRLCSDNRPSTANTPIELIEIYAK